MVLEEAEVSSREKYWAKATWSLAGSEGMSVGPNVSSVRAFPSGPIGVQGWEKLGRESARSRRDDSVVDNDTS